MVKGRLEAFSDGSSLPPHGWVALYGVVLLLAAIVYFTLTCTLIFHYG
ncbi:MAG: hypothetical protein MUF72_21230 [Elainella sp. Prado103]|nr:hypothetical protein [Elainella sp. Prado103]